MEEVYSNRESVQRHIIQLEENKKLNAKYEELKKDNQEIKDRLEKLEKLLLQLLDKKD